MHARSQKYNTYNASEPMGVFVTLVFCNRFNLIYFMYDIYKS